MTTHIFLVVLAVILSVANGIQWNDGDGAKWASQCDFNGSDIGSTTGGGETCGNACKAKSGCTRFAWTNYNGGTCWLKSGPANGDGAIQNGDPSSMCGYLTSNNKPG